MDAKAQSTGRSRPLPYLRRARKVRGISARELARQTGIARDTVLKLEHLRRGAYQSTIAKLAEALGAEPWQLTGIDPWEPTEQEREAMRQLLKTGEAYAFFVEEEDE